MVMVELVKSIDFASSRTIDFANTTFYVRTAKVDFLLLVRNEWVGKIGLASEKNLQTSCLIECVTQSI
ncbi:hypothetical protein BpHYR1_026190 [Brachionus plicatilis]|uniref:Uncharacterized protein n=1 Tax=Brachionus plicatilis TaxID=10195 RepID=A0A3M7T8V0_BRAPC|nr:hypothetical protein BpHYR1_026190 [Brachionus plicatilis]